jgi:hypothetical protein
MDGGTVTGGKFLDIYQRTDSTTIGAATSFATSFFKRGTISTGGGGFFIEGETNHAATLQMGSASGTPVIDTNFTVFNQFATVNWTLGNVTVTAGQTVTNSGSFNARSAGSIGNNLGAGNTWNFTNNRGAFLEQRAANQFVNNAPITQNGILTRRVAVLGTPDTSEIIGAFVQNDDADATTTVESGTLLVTGTFSQTKGDLTIMADSFVTVTSDFTESSDSTFNIELTTPISGSGHVTVGGVLTLDGSALNITALPGFDGDQFTLIDGSSTVVGTFDGLSEGAEVAVGGLLYTISYVGGDGFDVVLNQKNQAPVNTLPGNQTMNENGTLVFSTTNGNALSIADADAGSGSLEVTIGSSMYARLTLSSITGLTFISGSGTNDQSMTFRGTLANINAALNGMTYVPDPDWYGTEHLYVSTDDLGNSGSGGNLTDYDELLVFVDPI